MFTTISTDGTSTFGVGFLSGLQMMSGDVFPAFFDDGIADPIAGTLSFPTTPTPIPAPASGVLLGGTAGYRRVCGARAKGWRWQPSCPTVVLARALPRGGPDLPARQQALAA